MMMADDAHEERFRQHEAIMEGLAHMLTAQHAMNERQDALNERLTLAIERIDRTLAHVEITQARMETLLAHMIRHEDNGTEA
jgi:hypothetical protein